MTRMSALGTWRRPVVFGHDFRVSLTRKVYERLPEYGSEKEFVDKVVEELKPHFHIEREAALTHWTGARLVVDAVMQPREPGR